MNELEQYLKYIEKNTSNVAKQLANRIFTKTKLLIKFPGMGRSIQQIEEAKIKAEYRMALEVIPLTDLELKELIIDKYVLMYGYTEKAVVIFFIKHQAQQDYTLLRQRCILQKNTFYYS